MGKHIRKLIEQPGVQPTRKVTAGAFANSAVVLTIAILNYFNIEVDAIIATALMTFITGVVQYTVKDREL